MQNYTYLNTRVRYYFQRQNSLGYFEQNIRIGLDFFCKIFLPKKKKKKKKKEKKKEEEEKQRRRKEKGDDN